MPRRMPRLLSVIAGLVLTASAPAAAQPGAITSALTPAQIAASEAMAAKYDQSAAKEQARLSTFKNRPLGAVIQRSFNVFSNYVMMAAQMMPESGYSFRPTADVRNFGEQINHATGSHYSFCNQPGLPPGVERKAPPNLREITSKAAIVQALKDSVAYCDGLLAAATDAWLSETGKGLGGSSSGLIEGMRAHAFMYNTVHLAEDYGTITTYMRMQGVVPPSTASHPPAQGRGTTR